MATAYGTIEHCKHATEDQTFGQNRFEGLERTSLDIRDLLSNHDAGDGARLEDGRLLGEGFLQREDGIRCAKKAVELELEERVHNDE